MYALCTHDGKEIHTGRGRGPREIKPVLSTTPALARPADIGTIATTTTRCGCPIWLYDPSKSGASNATAGIPMIGPGRSGKLGKHGKSVPPSKGSRWKKPSTCIWWIDPKRPRMPTAPPMKTGTFCGTGAYGQQSLQPMAEQEKISYLDPITARHLNS
jgi:hypothetical protein